MKHVSAFIPRRVRRAAPALVAAALLVGAGPLRAQAIIEDFDYKKDTPAPAATDDGSREGAAGGPLPTGPATELPQPMPPVRGFDELVPFKVDFDTSNRFAIDPDAIRVDAHVLQTIVAVRTRSGVVNTSLMAFDCRTDSYRLLALALPDGQWHVTGGSTVRWRDVRDEARSPLHRNLMASACGLAGRSVGSAAAFVTRLTEGRRDLP